LEKLEDKTEIFTEEHFFFLLKKDMTIFKTQKLRKKQKRTKIKIDR